MRHGELALVPEAIAEPGSGAEQDQPITADVLSGIYATLLRDYYGDAIDMNPFTGITWSRIPHFFNSPYNAEHAGWYHDRFTDGTAFIRKQLGMRVGLLE